MVGTYELAGGFEELEELPELFYLGEGGHLAQTGGVLLFVHLVDVLHPQREGA